MQRSPFIILIALWLLPVAAQGEAIKLVDGTKIIGDLVHFYDGILTIQLPNGTMMKLPATKVQDLRFKLPKPRPGYSTPQKSFKQMREAALKGDLPAYIECHSTYYQMFLNHQVEMMGPKKFSERLKKEWGDVQLQVVSTQVEGNTAIMKVRRLGDSPQDGELRFIKENNEWKMILPL